MRIDGLPNGLEPLGRHACDVPGSSKAPSSAVSLHRVLDEERAAWHSAGSDVVPRYPSFRSSRRYLRRARNAVAVLDFGFRVTAHKLGGYVASDMASHPKG
jgi:hypothetical protein